MGCVKRVGIKKGVKFYFVFFGLKPRRFLKPTRFSTRIKYKFVAFSKRTLLKQPLIIFHSVGNRKINTPIKSCSSCKSCKKNPVKNKSPHHPKSIHAQIRPNLRQPNTIRKSPHLAQILRGYKRSMLLAKSHYKFRLSFCDIWMCV